MFRSSKLSRLRRQDANAAKKLNKKLIIGLIIFAVVAIGATAGAIIWKNSAKVVYETDQFGVTRAVDSDGEYKAFPDESGMIVRRGDLYATNQLQITRTEGDKDSGGNPVTYPQIAGLKNQQVQNKINDEIKAAFYYISGGALAEGANTKSVYCYDEANFANILSVTCMREDHNYDANRVPNTETVASQHIYLNYRLDTGEKLRFSDVFVAGANMNALVTSAFYATWVGDYRNWECTTDVGDNFCPELQPVYPADLEERALTAAHRFQRQSEPDFYIKSDSVIFRIGDQELILDFLGNYDQIAIYKRFADAKDLYDNQHDSAHGFVFQPAFRTVLGKVGDNLFVDCTNLDYYNPNLSDSVLQQGNYMIEQQIANAERLVAKTSDQVAVLVCRTSYMPINSSYSQSSFRGGAFDSMSMDAQIFTMSKTYFDQTGWPKILDVNYAPHPSAYTYSSSAFFDYEVLDKENVSLTVNRGEWLLVDGQWQDLTYEYSDWMRGMCLLYQREFDEPNLRCRY
jgi:hypothetical protein